MKMISFSEYEFGLIAFGERPFGVIAIGTFPVGVVALGALPIGIVSIAVGGSVGIVSYSCGASVGVYSRIVGFGIGVNTAGLGLTLSAVDPDTGWSAISTLRKFAAILGSVAIISVISWFGFKYFAVSQMTTTANLSWKVRLIKAEGIHFPPDTSCVVRSEIRTDTKQRIHATTSVQCGELILVERLQREKVVLVQGVKNDGFTYQMAASSPWKSSYTSETDGFVSEVRGLEFDSINKGSIVVLAEEAPFRLELSVEKESEIHKGEPLIVGKSSLEGVAFW